MYKIIKIDVEELENAGCNNGNYPEYTVYFENGEKYTGITCNCGSGCSETDCIRDLEIGMEFNSIEEFEEFIRDSDDSLKSDIDEIPEDVPGFWEASEEEQKEIDDIISDLGIDFK